MKQMKYIKLFEAFESKKLSKTLGYAKENKDRFLDNIKRICNQLDFPYSQLSDEYFDYLPFNAALKKTDILTDEPCDATGADAFERRFVVAGETCKGGQLKRKWGRSVRSVTCPVCNGTGVKPKKGEPKMVKFWFTKEGRFIISTCVDGLVRDRNKSGDKVPQGRSKYTHVRAERINGRYASGGMSDGFQQKLDEFQVGQYVLLKLSDGQEVYGVIARQPDWYNRNRTVAFVVQSVINSDTPSNSTEINGERWNKYGRYAINISNGYFEWVRPVTIKNADDEVDNTPDPYEWNSGLSFNYSRISATGRDIENEISDANFALILDFSKLKKAEFKGKSVISSERQEGREGAVALMKDSDIKSQNIKRYIDELAKRMEISKDLGNVDKVILKILGFKNAFHFIRSGRAKDAIVQIIENYLRVLSADDEYKERYINDLNSTIKSYYREFMNYNKDVTRNLEEIKKRLNLEKPSNYEKYLKILSLLEEFSLVAYNNVKESEMESIDDVEVVYQKLLSIKNLLTISRYNVNKLGDFINYLSRTSSDYSYRYLVDNYNTRNYLDDIISGLEKIINIAKKM